MSSFKKEVENVVKLIDFEIGKLDQELGSVEECVTDDLAMIVSKLHRPTDEIPDTTPYKNRLVTIRTILLKNARKELTDFRSQLTFALEVSAT